MDDSNKPTAGEGGPQSSNVVSLEKHARKRQSRAQSRASGDGVPALPDVTGVAQIQSGQLLENLRASCLTDATIDAARLFVLPSPKWRVYGFRSARPQPGLFLPFFAPGAAEPYGYRLRPSFPLPAPKRKGKFKKYDQVYGVGLLIYTPPLPATVDRLQDLSTPLLWTEGEKKALLLAQLGHCVVGLTGVDCWHDVEAKLRGDGRKLAPYIREHYAIAGRQHVIVFDADARSNPHVMLAMQKLAGTLSHEGAAAVHMCLPPEGGDVKGIDDYAHAHGVEACANLLATVREPVEELPPDLGCVPLKHFGKTFEGSGAERLRMPRGYDCEKDGSIWVHEDPTDPDAKKLVLDAPMVITKQLHDIYSGETRCEVRFQDARGAWRSVLVPRETLGDRALVAALRPYGALVNNASATMCMRYLDAFERDNGTLIEVARCSAQTGWHEGQFVLAQTIARADASPIQLDGTPEQLRLLGAIAPAQGASVSAHVAALRVPMEASTECALAVYAALAAPLLALVRQGNFALHLCGDSSRGKTSMLRISASVYGNPRSAAWVASWNTTAAGLEQRASLLCDLPQFYDEIGAGGPLEVESAVYMLVNGEGRQRSNKDLRVRETRAWRTVVVSSGEPELVDRSAATGAQARVINLPVQGFGALSASEIDAAVAACTVQYGALGRDWLQWLVSLDDEDLTDLRELYSERLVELRQVAADNGDVLGQRVAAYFAAMQVAEDQLQAWWGLGAAEGATVRTLFAARAAEAEDRVQPLRERVLDCLRDWVAGNPAAFPRVNDVTDNTQRVYGYLRDGSVAFLRGPMAAHLAEQGLHWTRALQRELRAAGVLLTEESQRRRGDDTVRVWVGGQLHRTLAIRLEAVVGNPSATDGLFPETRQ